MQPAPRPTTPPGAAPTTPEQPAAEENLIFALVAGGIAAVVAGAIWAGITIATQYQIGWMAVGVGFLVGVVVRAAGKGVTAKFGVIGGGLALLGCLLGDWLVPVFSSGDMRVEFTPIDLLFYAIAVYEGWKFSWHHG